MAPTSHFVGVACTHFHPDGVPMQKAKFHFLSYFLLASTKKVPIENNSRGGFLRVNHPKQNLITHFNPSTFICTC